MHDIEPGSRTQICTVSESVENGHCEKLEQSEGSTMPPSYSELFQSIEPSAPDENDFLRLESKPTTSFDGYTSK